ncbi:hypothetical protein QBC32DRAFT_351012 [Pseudoneurospora amorphoporcata]|uniref:Uncharacterized protein n=1 Tax=Pseudoneurospora amorphoporcata TaxID=241081 RepID=A0AAN6SC03_9PEZI|nr:hypothetical protein QBC32DRAFT_351012 [Pseudoneurospora amorphoporcata]
MGFANPTNIFTNGGESRRTMPPCLPSFSSLAVSGLNLFDTPVLSTQLGPSPSETKSHLFHSLPIHDGVVCLVACAPQSLGQRHKGIEYPQKDRYLCMKRAGLPVSRHRRQNNTLRLYTRSPSCCSSPSLAETQQ